MTLTDKEKITIFDSIHEITESYQQKVRYRYFLNAFAVTTIL